MNNNVIVVGTISCGKSTFLNCILQKNHFKMGDGVTTRSKSQHKLNNLQITDLPGLNEFGTNNLDQYKDDIKKAIAVVVLFDKTTIEADSTAAILKCVLDCRKNYKDKNIFYILNKIDDIHDQDSVLGTIVSQVGKFTTIRKEDILPISAKNALSCIMFQSDEQTDEQYKLIMKASFGHKWKDEDKGNVDNEALNDIYKDSNFLVIKNVIESLDAISVCSHIVENNDHLPYNVLVEASKKYNEWQSKKRKIITGVSVSALSTGAFVGGLILVGVSVPLIVSAAGAGFGAVSFTSGLAAIGGSMAGGLAVVGTVSTISVVGLGATAAVVAAAVSGVGTKVFIGSYNFGDTIRSHQIDDKQMKAIKKYLNGDYKKKLSNLQQYYHDDYKQDKEYNDTTFFEKDNEIFMISGTFIKNKLIKTLNVVKLVTDVIDDSSDGSDADDDEFENLVCYMDNN
jgi:GTPase SAR1 family protein